MAANFALATLFVFGSFGAIDGPDQFVVPPGSPVELSEVGPEHGDPASFTGAFVVDAKFTVTWWLVDDEPERLDVIITPSVEDLERLPRAIDASPEALYVSNPEEVVHWLFEADIAASVLSGQVSDLEGRAQFNVTDYATAIECDQRYYMVKVLSADRVEESKAGRGLRVGC